MERIHSSSYKSDNVKLTGVMEADELYIKAGLKGRPYHNEILNSGRLLPRERNSRHGKVEVLLKKILQLQYLFIKEESLSIAYTTSLGKVWEAEITAIHVIDPGRAVPAGRVKGKELQREEEAERPAEDVIDEV